MITRSDLLEIIADGENSEVEFKRDELENHALAKELVAFSNLGGGIVLLGVEDDGQVSGLNRSRIEEWVMTTCRDKVRPGLIPFFKIFKNFEDGKDIAMIRVPPGFDVHTLWHNNKNSYYIRVGSQSREPSPQELSRLFQQRGAFRAELGPVSGASVIDLDIRRLRDYFGRVREQDFPLDGDVLGWNTLLANTEIMTEDGITVAGMLLFGKNPNRFLPQAGITAAAFPNKEKDYAARERATLRGPMTPLFGLDGEMLEAGLVEQAIAFCKRNTPISSTLIDGIRREEKNTYPTEVIREAIINALIHRDYLLLSTDVEMVIYKDRMEIISPGKLPNGITISGMRDGVRAARNQLLKDIMRDYGYLEHMGMGIPRKIIKGMKKHNNTEPYLEEQQNERFLLRLFA